MVWALPMVAPEIRRCEHLAGKALVLKVDTEANGELSSRFGIRSIPRSPSSTMARKSIAPPAPARGRN